MFEGRVFYACMLNNVKGVLEILTKTLIKFMNWFCASLCSGRNFNVIDICIS